MARCAPGMHCICLILTIPIQSIHAILRSSAWSHPVGLAAPSLRARPLLRRASHRPSEEVQHSHSHFPPVLLEAGRSMAQSALRFRHDEKHSHVYVIRSFGRAKAFREMTCGILEKLLPCLGVCLLAVAVDDPELETRQNAGPWKDRMLVGVRGAERQVAFIDQIMPKGPSFSSTLSAWLVMVCPLLAQRSGPILRCSGHGAGRQHSQVHGPW